MKYSDFLIQENSLFFFTWRWWKGPKFKNVITSSVVYGLCFGAVLDIFIIWPHCTMGLIRPAQSVSWRILCHLPDLAPQVRRMDVSSFSTDLQVVLGLPRCLFPFGVQNKPLAKSLGFFLIQGPSVTNCWNLSLDKTKRYIRFLRIP